MHALARDDLVSEDPAEGFLDEVTLQGHEGQLLLHLVKEDRTEFVNIHLTTQLYHRFVISTLYGLGEEDGT
jgi:hypothetical protein